MPKRRFDGLGAGLSPMPPQRHLYLVLDDWECGYSIREVDLSSDDPGPLLIPAGDARDGAMSYTAEQPLPPPIFRFEAQRKMPFYFAAAFDSKIVALQPMPLAVNGTHPMLPKHLVPVFDVRQRSLIFGPRPMLDRSVPIYIPVGNMLFALFDGSFGMLGPPPHVVPNLEGWEWSWCEPPKPPFKIKHVASHAVHPNGGTIFVSRKKHSLYTTFTFDTITTKWKLHGDWMLPFTGRAHFDHELNAWVGLPRHPGAFGHLCSCDVVSASSTFDEHGPAFKLTKEMLFSEDPKEVHVGATLVYMGGRSEFCLVECVRLKDGSVAEVSNDSADEMDEDVPQQVTLLRLTTFSLKYDKKGALTTGDSRRVWYYSVSNSVSVSILKHPVAFWM